MARTYVHWDAAADIQIANHVSNRPNSETHVRLDSDQNLESSAVCPQDFDDDTYRQLRGVLEPDRMALHLATLDAKMIELAAPEGSFEELASAAHSMVTQAGMFGFVRLSALSRQLEADLGSGNDVGPLLASIRSAVSVAQSRIIELQAEDSF